MDNDENASSEDEDIVDSLVTERQKGKRKASALAVKPMEPPPKKVKKSGGMFLADSMDSMSKEMSQQTKEMARQTSQREDEVVQMMENLPLTHIKRALAMIQVAFKDDEEMLFRCEGFFGDASKAYLYITLPEARRNIWLKRTLEEAGLM